MDLHGNILQLYTDDLDLEVIDVLNRNKQIVMERIVDCVDIGYNLSLEYIPVLQIVDQNFELGIEQIDYLEKLQNAELFFAELENYDMCMRIVDIRSRIE